jgi:hypothetical protein
VLTFFLYLNDSFALYSANSENITVLNSTCTGASHCYRFEEGSTMIRIDGGVLTENFNTDKTGLITFNLVNDVVFRNVVFIQ